MKKSQFVQTSMASLAGLSLLTSACGPQAFNVVPSTSNISAPGGVNVPPKVDILLVEDDTGSIAPILSSVSAQAVQFLNQLKSQGWNAHFAVAPLTTQRPIQQVVDLWTPAWPGQTESSDDLIPSPFLQTPGSFSAFITPNEVSSVQQGMEPGFQTLAWTLTSGLGSSNFLSPDSLPVVLVIGNGNDTSEVNFGSINGKAEPCGIAICAPDTRQSSLNQYLSTFQGIRSNLQFYAAIDPAVGTRYQWMAAHLGGQTYDISTQSVNQVFSSLSSNLTSQRLNFQSDYLFISQNPNANSIQVTRYVGGNANQAVTIPQSATNGWTYVGYVSNVPAINYPAPMSYSTGYAIALHGSAVLTGGDTASVTYTPAGAVNSVTE